ncbi:MAG TPA: hypothetical protein EYP23_01965 [Thermoplasmata archaeon]|nr:hypothetical protein [Thermoplasmata archaeon]
MCKASSIVVTVMLLTTALILVNPMDVKTDGNGILYVGGSGLGNYISIQQAIDDASDSDTVFVY